MNRVPDRLRPDLADAEYAVLVSGITSMGLEIIAGRHLALTFGSHIYTWGSIIGVFLAALSLGYYLGGRRAPERASRGAIVAVLLQAAVFVAFLLVAGDLVLKATDALPLPARLAPVLPVAILFGPSVFLLGFISPYAAELVEDASAGEASGRVYALGTVGSIAGAFGTTFFLVPAFDVVLIEVGFGLLLVLTAATVARRTAALDLARVCVVALLLVSAGAVSTYGLARPGDTLYETDTAYQHLEVVEDDGVRTLYLDGERHSATYVDGREGYVFEYTRYLHLPMLLQETDEVDRVLFVGGGGFSTPKRYLQEYPNVTVDVVEIDPEVVSVAREYFGVEGSPRLDVHVADGKEFLEETDRTYDVIVLDAFRKDKVPFHLTTVEFMDLVSERLEPDGAVVANVISATDGSGSAFFRSQYKTMQRAFPNVYAFPTTDTEYLQNIELVATKDFETLSAADWRRLARSRAGSVGLNLTDAVAHYRGPGDVPTDDVPVLRADRAPVSRLLDPQLGRRYVIVENNAATNGTATTTTAG